VCNVVYWSVVVGGYSQLLLAPRGSANCGDFINFTSGMSATLGVCVCVCLLVLWFVLLCSMD
jgi:hypothetical protein